MLLEFFSQTFIKTTIIKLIDLVWKYMYKIMYRFVLYSHNLMNTKGFNNILSEDTTGQIYAVKIGQKLNVTSVFDSRKHVSCTCR